MENFPERRERIKSSVITVVVGEEASQWILELVPDENQDSALSASLWRIDHLSTDLEVTLTLTASCPSLTLQGPAVTASSPVTRLTDSEQARLGIHLVSFLTEALEKSPHNDTLRVECQLTARNPRERPHCDCTRKNSLPQLEPVTHWVESLPHSLDDLDEVEESETCSRMEEKHLVFGPVEEVHYQETRKPTETHRPKERMWSRITRTLGMLGNGIEAGNNMDPYILLHS